MDFVTNLLFRLGLAVATPTVPVDHAAVAQAQERQRLEHQGDALAYCYDQSVYDGVACQAKIAQDQGRYIIWLKDRHADRR